jgi:hypothetical protein
MMISDNRVKIMSVLITQNSLLLALLCVLGSAVTLSVPAQAVTSEDSAVVLGQALTNDTGEVLYSRDQQAGGLSLSSVRFTGRSSGSTAFSNSQANGQGLLTEQNDKYAELLGDRRVHALMIDGRYDFNDDLGTGLPIHPYVGAGAGLALYEPNSSLKQEGSAVPLFRLGGGIVVKLGPDWDLSLNYKAGYSGSAPSGSTFTGRAQESVDLHALDMGLKLKF